MRLNEQNLDLVRSTKNAAARIAIAVERSERQVQRYIKDNSFPDEFDQRILSVIETISIQNGR